MDSFVLRYEPDIRPILAAMAIRELQVVCLER
jgi:hypothetical protein